MIRLVALPLILLLAAVPASAQSAAESADPERAALLIATIRANDCAMTEDEAADSLPGLGYDMTESQAIVSVLLSAGLVGFDNDRLILDDALCAGDPAEDAAVFAAAAQDAGQDDGPPMVAMEPEALVGLLRDSLGAGFVRGAAELLAESQGCAIDFTDPAAGRAAMVDYLSNYVAMLYGQPQPLPDLVTAELGAMVDTFRADPGPFFADQDGRLVLDGCDP
jgi:hypothetical protein